MYLHEMWMYGHFMAILNSYVSTRAHPEASMIEGYCTEEAIESGGPFCNSFLKDQVAIGLPPSRHEGRLHGSGRIGRKSFILPDYNTVLEAYQAIGKAIPQGPTYHGANIPEDYYTVAVETVGKEYEDEILTSPVLRALRNSYRR